jgi:hypothetical protein
MAFTPYDDLREPEPVAEHRLLPVHDPLDEMSTPLDPPPMCGLPRRFSVSGMLIVMTLAALLMGFLRQCHASGSVYFIIVTFVVGTLAAQVMLFRGRSPTKASVCAGALLLPLEMLAVVICWQFQSPASDMYNKPHQFFIACLCGCAALVPLGAVLGAVAGTVGGGLYLLSEEIFLWLTRGVPKIVLEPVEDADADVLIRWIRGPNSCRRWAGDQLAWPLSRQQLLDRFATARGEQPLRHIFKAVDRRTGAMLGYVELGRIDPPARSAALELPLVDPGASERGRLSVLLFQTIGKRAFGKLELRSLTVDAQGDLALCCREAWLATYICQPFEGEGEVMWMAKSQDNLPMPQ